MLYFKGCPALSGYPSVETYRNDIRKKLGIINHEN